MTATQQDLDIVFDRYFDAWASRDVDRIAALHSEDGTFCLHSGDGVPVTGRQAIREAFAEVFQQFPDYAAELVHKYVGDNFITCEWRFSGTPSGSTERIAWDAIDIYTFRDGLCATKDTYIDLQSILTQLQPPA